MGSEWNRRGRRRRWRTQRIPPHVSNTSPGRRDVSRVMLFCSCFLMFALATTADARKTETTDVPFAFTAPLYNFSFLENSQRLSRPDDPIMVGVPKLDCYEVDFKFAGSGAKKFEPVLDVIGDFAFLSVRLLKDYSPLNRELEPEYAFVVKAICKRSDGIRTENTANVHVLVRDMNEQSPLAEKDEYAVSIDNHIAPFSDVIRIDASDADAGLNHDVYFSLVNQSSIHDFYIEPTTGWIRTLRSPIKRSSALLTVRFEDRSSRLFYYDEKTRTPESFVTVAITIVDRHRSLPKILVERRKVDMADEAVRTAQLAAIVRVEGDNEEKVVKHELLIMNEHETGGLFEIRKEPTINSWSLYTRAGLAIPLNAKVVVRAGSEHFPENNRTAEIVIEAEDKHNIAFNRQQFEMSAREDLPVGAIVGRVQAIPLRKDDNNLISYQIEPLSDGNMSLPFSIEPNSGRIRVIHPLDYELNSEYTFSILAKLRSYGHQTTAVVTIRILDSNDHAPEFSVRWKNHAPISIPKTAKNNTNLVKVSALDLDLGDNGRVGYKLVSQKETPLRIDFDSGQIYLGAELPKNETSWVVDVVAVDWGLPLPRSSQISLVFFKQGTKAPSAPKRTTSATKDQHAPILLEEDSPMSIDEDADVGTMIGVIPTRDDDVGYAGRVRLATFDSFFDVDPDSGVLSVGMPLQDLLKPGDREVLHEVEVIAYDNGIPMRNTTRKYAVRVVDVNNHVPKFDKSWYRISVSEGTQPGDDVLLQVMATDEDGGENGRVRFEISGGEHLNIDETTGKITLREPFDREKAEIVRYTIIAFDAGHPSRVAFANLTIDVQDVNDNPPQCSDPHVKMSIPEDWPSGGLITCISAHDVDAGENGRLSFTLGNDTMEDNMPFPFHVDRRTGCVFVNSRTPLDFERRPSYDVPIEVWDNADEHVQSTICMLTVQLIDVNENRYPPQFASVALDSKVSENVGNADVIGLFATDPDGSDSGITYEIIGASSRDLFRIDEHSILKTLRKLDNEAESHHWVTIRATDSAVVPLSSYVHVFVLVEDLNEHAPLFKEPFYEARVVENSPPNTIVTKVEAEDRDYTKKGSVPQFKFSIEKGDSQSNFKIDETTGYISLNERKVDRETKDKFILDVRVRNAKDQPNPNEKSSITKVIIDILDENDCAPTFVSPNARYPVPAGVKGLLCTVLVHDFDSGKNGLIKYSMKTIDPRFEIDQHGRVSTNESLKEGEVASMEILVTDSGDVPLSSSTRITISAEKATPLQKGKKNHAPVFTGINSYHFTIADKDKVGTVLASLSVSDEDDDTVWQSLIWADNVPSEVKYMIMVNERNDKIMHLLLAKTVSSIPINITQFNVTGRITDGEKHTEVLMTFDILRSSDIPRFSSSRYLTSVSEKTPIGSTLLVAQANGTTNAPIEYRIELTETEEAARTIGIDPSSGTVMLIGPLDHESTHELRVVLAARQGLQEGRALLTVLVEDDNDNPPVFTQSEYLAVVEKGADVGRIVTTVDATDKDKGENGEIRYSIISGNEHGLFYISEETGEIRVAKDPSSSHVASILTVRATDKGVVPLSGVTTVKIRTVRDSSAEYVQFLKPLYHRDVRENTPIGSLLLTVQANSSAPHLRYSLKQKCTWFEVHPISGAIRLRRWLTRVRVRSINCTIVATTRKEGVEASTKVVMRILETNEHAPVFRQQIYHGFVRENSATGTPVVLEDGSPLYVSAVDRDTGPNALVGYRLLAESDAYFTVDFVSGAIRTRKPLDYERMHEWRFHVIARDMGDPSLLSAIPALIVIAVQDVNDCPPAFARSEYTVDFLKPTMPGITIFEMSATDADTVGTLQYYLAEKSDLFSVDAESGRIVTKNESKAYNKKEYSLDVIVSDGAHTASSTVKVRVKDSPNEFRFTHQEYVTSIVENTVVDNMLPLVTVTAYSTSTAGAHPITYSLVNTRESFSISAGTGLISLTKPTVDREESANILLIVQAKLHSFPPLLAQSIVRITVLDVNDNKPVFVSLPYSAIVSKDVAEGSKILQVRAIDADHGANGTIVYSSTDIPSNLKLNKKDGKVTLGKKFASDAVVTFTVTASDQGTPPLSSSASVSIEVVHKSRPICSHRPYYVTVKDTLVKKGAKVASIKASSAADSSRIVYTIDGGDDNGEFNIDVDTGALYLSTVPTSTVYNLTVIANDVTKQDMFTKCHINIEIASTRVLPPEFTNATYVLRLSESTPIGMEVLKLEVKQSGSRRLAYVLNGSNATVFSMNPSTGVITLAAHLDYETQTRYVLYATVQDDQQATGKSVLIVQVEDANDEPPVFVHPFSSASVSETAAPGAFVTLMSVLDKDTVASLPDGQRLLFSVLDGDDTLFTVNKSTGEVRLGRYIEDEDVMDRKKLLNISVCDGIQTSFGRLEVNILVSATKAQAPRFEQSQYVVAVKETAIGSNASLIMVRAVEGVAPLRYSLGGGHASWPVGIDKHTGKVHLRTHLKHNEGDNRVIPLVVTDGLGRRAFSTLTLRVQDVNDAFPVFPVNEYSSSISSSARPGESVVQILATDADPGDVMDYDIVDANHTFTIDRLTGIVSVAAHANLDNLAGRSMTMRVRAHDSANPAHSSSAILIVSIAAKDIPVPRFANSHYVFTVPEDSAVGFTIGKVQQIASDIGDVQYEVEPKAAGLPFSIDKQGKLIVQAKLDTETRDLWSFVVIARAAGGVHAMATVSVHVADVNDNAPMFRGTYDRMSVSEDAPLGTSIAVFSATDKDDVHNTGTITFSLLESMDSTDVHLDPSSGWLTVASLLDRERKAEYHLTAQATDQGGLYTQLNFTLKINDANDEPPVFDERNYTIRMDANNVILGQTIGRVTVTDKDLPPHNAIRLFIVAGNDAGLFGIDDTGRISVAKHAFPNGTTTFEITLLASDGVHENTAIVTIHVSNKNVGEMSCPTDAIKIELLENTAPSTVLAVDPLPSVAGLRYSLMSSEVIPFEVAPGNGSITVAVNIDREKTNKFSFIRRADIASPLFECAQRIDVTILDENDNSPVFDKKAYSYTIKENQPASVEQRQFLLRVNARDADIGKFGRVAYSITPEQPPFTIDRDTGAILVTAPLDREARSEYTLNVVASDSDPTTPKTTTASVKITVADQNDNQPEFERKEYELQVMESEAVGYSLLTVRAVGGDEGETVTYELIPGHADNKFVKINRTTGVLTLASPLDYEKSKSLLVKLRATDSGEPPLSSETTVTIEVLDENDNSPVFMGAPYKVQLKENIARGSLVEKVKATDADSGHYGSVVYAIDKVIDEKSELVEGMFTIERETGQVKAEGDIDYEKNKLFTITISAMDGGTPPRVTSTDMEVRITDANDNKPEFAECNMTAVVQENVDTSHVILSLSVIDRDSAPFGGPPFQMSVKGVGSDSFTVDKNMNVITTRKLENIRNEKFMLTIVAKDAGGLSAECTLTVHVKQESMNAPVVHPLKVTLNTLMGEYKGGVVGKIVAFDQDENDMLRYAIVDDTIISMDHSGNMLKPHLFRVVHDTGEVYSGHSIAEGTHSFKVSVSDGKFNVLGQVEVKVMEVSEHMISNAVAVTIPNMSITRFFSSFANYFREYFARKLNVSPAMIEILCVQENNRKGAKHGRRQRSMHSNWRLRRAEKRNEMDGHHEVDVLFVAKRSGSGNRGLIAPSTIYGRLRTDKEYDEQMKLSPFQIYTEVCTVGVCRRGGCAEVILLDDVNWVNASVLVEADHDGSASRSGDVISFVGPRYDRRAQCECPVGYGGADCSIEANDCAFSRCHSYQMCIPIGDTDHECVCPPGTTGTDCKRSSCPHNNVSCFQDAEVHVNGSGFFELSLANSLEERMNIDVEFRTTTPNGIIMHGMGAVDFHQLRLSGGSVEYHWNTGSGEGIASSSRNVADGHWHRVHVKRQGSKAELIVDKDRRIESESPSGSRVLNLGSHSRQLTFGAKVSRLSSGRFEISEAIFACFRRISIDTKPVPKTASGMKLHSAFLGCRTLPDPPCATLNSCLNGGRCYESYCECPSRYSGPRCEIDNDPCGDNPCPAGVHCLAFHNDFLCQCPKEFMGKRCEERRRDNSDVCASKPCGDFPCVELVEKKNLVNFVCNCSGTIKHSCDEGTGSFLSYVGNEILFGLFIVFVLIVVAAIILAFCKYRQQKKDKTYGEHVYAPHAVNTNLLSAATTIQPAPPLPPRGARNGNRPMIEVRPLAPHVSQHSRDSRSPSLAGSFNKWKGGRGRDSRHTLDDEMEQSCDSSARRDLEALRRIGLPIPDHALNQSASSRGSIPLFGDVNAPPPLMERRNRGRDSRREDSLTEERVPLGDNWDDRVDRVAIAISNERRRRENGAVNGHSNGHPNGRVVAGDTILAPLENDPDYMTMMPRKQPPGTGDSQRRPLLAGMDNDDDGESGALTDSSKPTLPAHKKCLLPEEDGISRVYDDPAMDSSIYRPSEATSNHICDIDASDDEARELPLDTRS